MGGDASPCDLPERVALDALASLARRVGASVAQGEGASLLCDVSVGHAGRRKRPHPTSTPLPPLRGQRALLCFK